MVKIRPEDKEEVTYTQYLPEGIHEVKITGITQETNANGKEYFEFEVADEDGQVGNARLYMSEKAMKYSISTIRGIFVHNTVEKNRDAVRKQVDLCEDTDELFKLSQALVKRQAKAWYSKHQNGQTYVNNKGETRNSYDVNISHFEPKPPKQMTADELIAKSEPIDDLDDIPFA